jgi:septal ring factor EnvC (AmiA/AmiB activator)
MQKDTIDDLFDDLKGEFDVNTPNKGHENRFLDKLKADDLTLISSKKSSTINWKPFLAIAASILICLNVFIILNNDSEVRDLASVSPELSETQDFFTATIENELKKLNKERSPFTENVINDALEQIKSLEKEYKKLKLDLTESGSDQRIIYAMITNFQNRIDILNIVLEEIETIKNLKLTTDDTKNTL